MKNTYALLGALVSVLVAMVVITTVSGFEAADKLQLGAGVVSIIGILGGFVRSHD